MKRNTSQKKAIFEVIEELDNHPTATMLIKELEKREYKVSRATVFRVLNEAEKEGIITKISSPDGEDRYDPHTEKHYHLRCKICSKIVDSIYPYHEISNYKEENGFLIESHNLEFVGICKECKEKIKSGDKSYHFIEVMSCPDGCKEMK